MPGERQPLEPIFSDASAPDDEFGSVTKTPPPGALPEPPDNSAGALPSQLDKLDGYWQGSDAYDWF